MNRIPELFQRKGIRDKKLYLQKDMAIGCGLSGNAISRLMRYQSLDNVPLSHAVAVAKWLEVHVEELIEEVDDEDVS